MSWTCSNPAQRRYLRRTMWIMGLYVVFVALVAIGFKTLHPTGVLAWGMALFTSLPTLGFLGITGLYLKEEEDEFLRMVQIYAMLGGIGLTLAVTTTWGFMEDFVHAPRLDLTFIYPLFWVATGISYVIVWMRYDR
ncbi:MAG: hypothetical protein WCE75_17125 [Terracidiphilus sp.]